MPSEVQILVIALVFAPLMVWTFRGTQLPNRPWLGLGLIAIYVAYILTVAEGYFPTDASPDNPVLNALEHVAYLVAAVCFAVSSTDFLKTRTWLEEREAK